MAFAFSRNPGLRLGAAFVRLTALAGWDLWKLGHDPVALAPLADAGQKGVALAIRFQAEQARCADLYAPWPGKNLARSRLAFAAREEQASLSTDLTGGTA